VAKVKWPVDDVPQPFAWDAASIVTVAVALPVPLAFTKYVPARVAWAATKTVKVEPRSFGGDTPGQQEQNHVVFLENLFDELRRHVPTGKLTHDRSNQFKLWRSGEARCGAMNVVYKAKDLKLGHHVLNAGLRLPGAA
jgi:hypothetical protein